VTGGDDEPPGHAEGVQRCERRRRCLGKGSGVLLDGRERFADPRPAPAGNLTERAEHVLLSRRLRLLVVDDVAGGAALRAQTEDVLTAEAGDGSLEHYGA